MNLVFLQQLCQNFSTLLLVILGKYIEHNKYLLIKQKI